MRDDSRGVSTVVSHILALGVVAILVVGLISGVGGFLDGKQSTARAEQLDIVGSRLASDLARADRLADGNTSVVIDASGPRSVAGGQYTTHLVPRDGDALLYVNASGTDTSTALPLGNETRVCEGHASGRSVSVVVSDDCLSIEDR